MNQQPPDESSSLHRLRPGQRPARFPGQSHNWDAQPSQQLPWNQQPTQAQEQSPWGQQPPQQQYDQSQWNQQPTQSDGPQQDFASATWNQPPAPQQSGQQQWNQQPTQQFGQSQWNQAPTQQQFDQSPWNQQPAQFQSPPPLLPPQPPRQSFWHNYRQSRPAQIISVVVLALLLASIVLAVFHFTSGPGGAPGGGTATVGVGGQTPTAIVSGGKASITADFGGRQNHAHPIPSTLLGIGGLGLTTVINAAAPYLPQASLRLTRFGGFMPTVFPTEASATDPGQQNWTSTDNSLSLIQQNHLQPIVTLSFSPSWLQPQNQNPPQPNNCQSSPTKVDPSHVRPTFMANGQDLGPQKWGQLAAQVIAHIDKSFPGLRPLYEIWNEPDGITYWCEQYGATTLTAGSERLAEYKTLYAAAAPLMKQQAQQDGTQISIGGPALAFPTARASIWIPALVNDPATAPYLDFISYHQYEEGKSWTQLVTRTQDPKAGYLAEFQLVASLVHAGHQPNAQSTPIYIDEYNGNDCSPNFCRNDPTYAPLWNTLFIADLLNSVNTQVANRSLASSIPTGVVYFTWSSPPQKFCMFGELNANFDCTPGSNAQAYPQYYAYKLIGGPTFLNIADNGYVANSTSSDKKGVFVAAFFTQGHDAILIVNTTAKQFSASNIQAKNAGETPSSAMYYTLNSGSPQIASKQINLQQNNGALNATIDIPAYSTVAITF